MTRDKTQNGGRWPRNILNSIFAILLSSYCVSEPLVFNSLNFHYVPAECVRMISKYLYCFTVFRSKKLSDRGSKHIKRLRFHPEVEELHYHRDDSEGDQDKRRVKGDKMGLFNPIKFLNSIDQWRIDKFETEIWIEMWHVSLVPFPFCDTCIWIIQPGNSCQWILDIHIYVN